MASNRNKTTIAAEKARKQKIIAVVGGVLLLAVVAIQGPKLWKQLNPPAPAPVEAAAVSAFAPAATVTGTVTPTQAAVASRSTATVVLAGVRIPNGSGAPQAQDGKLLSYSLFKAKDPFVPQVSEIPVTQSPTTTAAPTETASGSSTSTASTGASASTTDSAAPSTSAKPTYATIEVNGRAQKLALKDKFPKATPTFVLVKLSSSGAKIGVAGGSFKSGKLLGLPLGKQVALVDAATGKRSTLKLVYAGAEPEQTEAFTTAPTSTNKP